MERVYYLSINSFLGALRSEIYSCFNEEGGRRDVLITSRKYRLRKRLCNQSGKILTSLVVPGLVRKGFNGL